MTSFFLVFVAFYILATLLSLFVTEDLRRTKHAEEAKADADDAFKQETK